MWKFVVEAGKSSKVIATACQPRAALLWSLRVHFSCSQRNKKYLIRNAKMHMYMLRLSLHNSCLSVFECNNDSLQITAVYLLCLS